MRKSKKSKLKSSQNLFGMLTMAGFASEHGNERQMRDYLKEIAHEFERLKNDLIEA